MAPLDDISDDAVAEHLKKEAKESSIKYSAIGVDAFLPKRPANPKLKPNTRFLKTIIKEANSHNAALRKRELSRDVTSSTERRHSRRLSGDEGSADEYSRRQKRSERSDIDSRKNRPRSHREMAGSDGEHERRRRHRDRHHRHSRRNRSRSPHSEQDRERGRDRRDSRRSDTAEQRAEYSRKRRHRHRDHSTSPQRRRRHREVSDSNEVTLERRQRSTADRASSREIGPQGEDSDPLEHIIRGQGKPKAPVPRGRGANKARSHIDEHFSSSYNPATDVQPDSAEEDDWEQALEALKDRQRWKELGANRLREAGFSEGEVNKWERGGEQQEEDLRWKKLGEGREWDRGKVVTAAGDVETSANWST